MSIQSLVQFEKYKLDCGATLVVESHPQVHSCSIGIWVRAGSVNERLEQNGLSHFLEHMVFKGTETRGPLEIPMAIESVGGDLNAFTDREYICFHATVLTEHIPIALEILSDLVIRPALPSSELDRERRVLLQELSMVEDTPDEYILSLLFATVWKDDALGMPIIGSRKSLSKITRRHLAKFHRDYFRPDNIVVGVAGSVNPEQVRKLCDAVFVFDKGQGQLNLPKRSTPKFHSRRRIKKVDTEQLHLMLAYEAEGYLSDKRFEYLLLSYFLAGGMSSRLFQEIREKAGLAYNVDCDYIGYSDAGLFTFYLAMGHKSLKRCLQILKNEIMRLIDSEIDEKELDLFKGQLRGSYLMGSDSMEYRQESIARSEILLGRYLPVEEVITHIDRVTPADLNRLAKETFKKSRESTVVLCRDKISTTQLKVL